MRNLNPLLEIDLHPATHAALGLGSLVGGQILRNKRQKLIMGKILEKFPKPKDLYNYITKNGINLPTGQLKRIVDMNDYSAYEKYVAYNIAKKGHFWRTFGQIAGSLFAPNAFRTQREFDLDGIKIPYKTGGIPVASMGIGAYNAAKYFGAKNKSAEDILAGF